MSATTELVPKAMASMRPLNAIVDAEIADQLHFFFDALVTHKEALVLDGVRVFEANDQFLPGKISAALAHVLVRAERGSPDLANLLDGYRSILDLTAGMKNESWGIYYACAGLYALQQAGLLASAVSEAALAQLSARADWRRFVRVEDFTLINLPTNYYGVAFSIARLRMLLGWEDARASETLLEKTLHHYTTHSGPFGFCDDTDGEGRFDRYSILLIAEICERFIETGLTVTPQLRKLLRNSVDVVLKLANSHGDGFCFGRSLGPYGDTAMLQILAVAAHLEVLDADERPYAYSVSVAIVEKYIGFWFNRATHSVDMWGQGRRVDAYRGKSRILGENLSLLHQIVCANELWSRAGFKETAPHSAAQLQAWLDATQAKFNMVPFATGAYDRSLAIYRDKGRVFSLLMVNGGTSQHMNSPYYPLPFSPGVVEGIADSGPSHAQLMPQITLQDGTQLMGTAFFKNIRSTSNGAVHRVHYQLHALAQLGDQTPHADTRISSDVEYVFEPGKITRTERFTPHQPLHLRHLALNFLSFSSAARADGSAVRFMSGAVNAVLVSGLNACRVHALHSNTEFSSPNGPMQTHAQWLREDFSVHEPFTVQWTIFYN